MSDKEREAFERYIQSTFPGASIAPRVNNCGIKCSESYASPKVDISWLAWQARAQASQWQPMATAPRDGTRVLLITRQGIQFVGRCTDAESPFPWNHDCTGSYMAESKLASWMPLPADEVNHG